MTKETLAKLMERGYVPSPKILAMVERVEKSRAQFLQNGNITDIIILKKHIEAGDEIIFDIISKNLANRGIQFVLEVYDDDSLGTIGNDTLIFKRIGGFIADNQRTTVKFDAEMQKKAFGSWEGNQASCYIKISYIESGVNKSFSSQSFSVQKTKKVYNEYYYGQQVRTPSGSLSNIQLNAVKIIDEKETVTAFIVPEEKLFIWNDSNGFKGYFENGVLSHNTSYEKYAEDGIAKELEPFSWGVHLATKDSGQFVIDLVTNPRETISNFGKAISKIATLDFDIEKTWESIQKSGSTGAGYVAVCILMGKLATVNSTGTVKGVKKFFKAVKIEDLHKLSEIIEFEVQVMRITPLTWPEVLEIFKKALEFEVT